MNKSLRLLLFLLFLLGGRQVLCGQAPASTDWDELLDRFERICAMSLQVKASGNADADLTPLLVELDALRGEFKYASDRMPAAARRRYEAIRKMYYSGKVSDTRVARLPSELPELRPLPPALTKTAAPQAVFFPGTPPSPLYHVCLSASSIVLPELSGGLMAEYLGRKIGGYVAFRSNFSNHNISYSALSDGTSADGPVWTSGNSAVDRFFITAGPAVRLGSWISVYGGLGYGSRRLCWEDPDGNWMKVSDASLSGFCAELGVAAHLGRFVLSAGCLFLPASYGGLTMSVGYSFGRFY